MTPRVSLPPLNLPPIRRSPKVTNDSLHAFCVPNFFSPYNTTDFTLPKKLTDDYAGINERIRFYLPTANITELHLGIQRTNYTYKYVSLSENNTKYSFYSDFIPFIEKIIEKLQQFEKILRERHPNKYTSDYPLIHNVQIVFNRTPANNNGNMTQLNVNNWHDDNRKDTNSAIRQFSILLTNHLNTDFSINPDITQIKENFVHLHDIRRCSNTNIGSTSYWKNSVIHRKPMAPDQDKTTRIIIAVIFDFITDKTYFIKDNNIYFQKIIHKNKVNYNSAEHIQTEVYALTQVFDSDIKEPQKIVSGGRSTKKILNRRSYK